MPLFVSIVLDGVGIGHQPDAGLYGDTGADTLGHVLDKERPHLPNLEKAGLGCIVDLPGIEAVPDPEAAYGRMTELSAGKDSTTGHWELGGIRLSKPFPTYPDGFPSDVIEKFKEVTGASGALGNKAASGTEIISELGNEHVDTGFPIVYTSADSVFQIAAHVDVLSLDELYTMCERTRQEVCVGEHAVGRVIARPFEGERGAYRRISRYRKDFSYLPESDPLQLILQKQGVRTISVGKVADLFGGIGFDESNKTASNAEGIRRTIELMESHRSGPTFIWVNLVDFDQEYGHRNDAPGFANALEEFDRALPSIVGALPEDSRLVLTADHGNDPCFPGTDHTREYVPLLVFGEDAVDLGLRSSFSDHAVSVLTYFGVNDHHVEGHTFIK